MLLPRSMQISFSSLLVRHHIAQLTTDTFTGRTLNQCRGIYDEMMRTPRGTSLMRSTSIREFGPPNTAMKRPFNDEVANYGGRIIQPRPEGAPLVSPNEPTEPPKKKRGRPTKAEAEERRQAAVARGESYPMPRRASTVTAGPSSAPVLPRPASVAAAQAALGVAPRIVRATPPPPPPPEPTSSESSATKRRRGRPAMTEEEGRRAQETFTLARSGPGSSRYPDILSRDEPPDPQPQRPRGLLPPQQSGPEPSGSR